MSFIVESLELENFRSYRRGFVRFDPHLTILHGPNAAGKTNIIEALQLLTTGTSFRKAVKSDLIAAECVHTRLRMLATDGVLRRDIEFSIKDDVKSVTVNEKKVRSVYELCSVLPCVVFTPDDLRMVKDASSKRRQEIDGLGIQLSASYARLVSEYQKIRSQRNKMMKEDQFGSEAFVAWTDRMVD
ncbi:MAG: AAA family ATPase, partial [Coriobacteriia bacterium]|nr:AAA family ATPase [Coriobacteriia bacterium]